MNHRLPERVSGRILSEHGSGKTPVPMEFSGELLFPGGVSATFYCAFRTVNQQWAHVSGTNGAVLVPDFVLPFQGSEASFELNQPFFNVRGCAFSMESHPRRFAVREYSEGEPGSQEVSMIRNFSEIVTSGKLDPTWGEIALKTQVVLDACLQSACTGGALITIKG